MTRIAVLIAWVGLFAVAIGVGQGLGYFVGIGMGGIGCFLLMADYFRDEK